MRAVVGEKGLEEDVDDGDVVLDRLEALDLTPLSKLPLPVLLVLSVLEKLGELDKESVSILGVLGERGDFASAAVHGLLSASVTILTPTLVPVRAGMTIVVLSGPVASIVRSGWFEWHADCSCVPVLYVCSASAISFCMPFISSSVRSRRTFLTSLSVRTVSGGMFGRGLSCGGERKDRTTEGLT